MNKPFNFRLLLLPVTIPAIIYAQDEVTPTLNIGDPAPPMQVREWMKGAPVQEFQKDSIYVLEFWATWCVPCKAAMPGLSALANKYKGKVIVIGVDILEQKKTTLKKIKTFVDSMGTQMDYRVAVGDSNYMEKGWFDAAGERGIPHSFVVNGEGKLAWIGYPYKLEEVLPAIINNTWDIKDALVTRNRNRHLQARDREVTEELSPYLGDERYKPGDLGQPDSALQKIAAIVQQEPGLKYAPFVAFHTFSALLKTDPQQALAYGKEVMATPTYEEPACGIIADVIEIYSSRIDLPAEIYRLGAEAYQQEIDQFPYPQLLNNAKRYHKIAECYFCAGDKTKAIEAGQKAIAALKERKGYSAYDLSQYEYNLEEYLK